MRLIIGINVKLCTQLTYYVGKGKKTLSYFENTLNRIKFLQLNPKANARYHVVILIPLFYSILCS